MWSTKQCCEARSFPTITSYSARISWEDIRSLAEYPFTAFSLLAISVGVWCVLKCSNNVGWLLSVIGATILFVTISYGVSSYENKIKVDALVESGKYEIVTNEDYSLKELEQFMKVGDVYLKEVEEE